MWADQVDTGVVIVAGASCPHGVIVYWACGPARGLLAWCVTMKPSMAAAETLGLQFGERVFMWGTDPVEPADFFKKFSAVKKACSKVATSKQMALGILLVHLHSYGCTWDGFTPLSKRAAGSLVRSVKAAVDAVLLTGQPGYQFRTYVQVPPSPPPPPLHAVCRCRRPAKASSRRRCSAGDHAHPQPAEAAPPRHQDYCRSLPGRDATTAQFRHPQGHRSWEHFQRSPTRDVVRRQPGT